MYGLCGKLIKPGQLLQQAYYHAGVHAGHLFDLTPHDWILRGLRAGAFKLCPSWVTGKGVVHDPVRLNRYDRILKSPESCSERDLIFVLYGSVDKTGERRASYVRLGDSACVLDPELFDDGSFNPAYRGCATTEDCRAQWDGQAAAQEALPTLPAREPAPWFPPVMTTLGFLAWALVFVALLTVPDPTGRTVIWAWETEGKFYKSRLTNYLKRMHGAMTTSGSMEEKNIGNQITNYISLRGYGPKLIIIDKPRDGKPVNWEMIENLKNGMVVNVKWKVADVDWESPQIVIFANDDPAEFVGTKMSADKLVDVELRAFNASIEAGVIAPPQTLADLRAHPVVKSHD